MTEQTPVDALYSVHTFHTSSVYIFFFIRRVWQLTGTSFFVVTFSSHFVVAWVAIPILTIAYSPTTSRKLNKNSVDMSILKFKLARLF